MKKTNKIKPELIKENDIMAIVYYVKVKKTFSAYEIVTENLDLQNHLMSVRGKELLESAFSADQFTEEIKVTKTQAAELLIHATNRPFTVSFVKTDGTNRVLRGKLICPEPLLGRSMVEDLDEESDHKLRQVDHRTIEYLILEGTKYVVK